METILIYNIRKIKKIKKLKNMNKLSLFFILALLCLSNVITKKLLSKNKVTDATDDSTWAPRDFNENYINETIRANQAKVWQRNNDDSMRTITRPSYNQIPRGSSSGPECHCPERDDHPAHPATNDERPPRRNESDNDNNNTARPPRRNESDNDNNNIGIPPRRK